MTSEQQRKLKIIPLDEEERTHEELERACNDVNKSSQKVFDVTVRLIDLTYDRFLKEGKDSETELRKICREIWKKHPQHKRQIQRIFDWQNEVTGERPYRRFKGKHGEDDDAELYIKTKSGIQYDKKKTSYDVFKNELADESAERLDEIYQLLELEGIPIKDKKNLMHKLQDFASKLEKDLRSEELLPSNVNISYEGHKGKDDDTFAGIPEEKRKKITLQPADVPKDELTKLFQKSEAEYLYYFAKTFTKFGDKLTKMNYISDNVKLNESMLVGHIYDMSEIAVFNCVMIHKFMTEYWDKFKDKEKLSDEDKEIIRKLWRSLANVSLMIKLGVLKT